MRRTEDVRRREVHELVAFVGGEAGQGPDLVEGAGVAEPVDPLADGQPSLVVLALDALGSSHALGELGPPADLVELGLPGHEHQCDTTAR